MCDQDPGSRWSRKEPSTFDRSAWDVGCDGKMVRPIGWCPIRVQHICLWPSSNIIRPCEDSTAAVSCFSSHLKGLVMDVFFSTSLICHSSGRWCASSIWISMSLYCIRQQANNKRQHSWVRNPRETLVLLTAYCSFLTYEVICSFHEELLKHFPIALYIMEKDPMGKFLSPSKCYW